jgi:hypothetical protein
MLNPAFSNANINGLLSLGNNWTKCERGEFNIADTYVQPVWLGGPGNTMTSLMLSFYIPTGSYKTTIVTLPVVGPVQTVSASNTGYGFWTNQNQGVVYLPCPTRLAIETLTGNPSEGETSTLRLVESHMELGRREYSRSLRTRISC